MTTKYAIIVPDGAADEPLEVFSNQTPLQAAKTPNMDRISTSGQQGVVYTIPKGMPAGSDVAQMCLLGYDPRRYYTGRAPLEAAAKGIHLGPEDWVFRCNMVTYADGCMADHSAGHISTDEASRLLADLATDVHKENIQFHTGVSYRHLCVFNGVDFSKVKTEPPHDHIDEKVSRILPKGKNSNLLREIMARSEELFSKHDINRVRRDLGENPVSSVWLWGQGQRALLDGFRKKYGKIGAAITAVDLVRGIARLLHFDIIEVDGATGFANTNYHGKGQAAIQALEDHDLVFVHIEAPDEAGHAGNAEQKKYSIEQIDKYIVGPVYEALKQYDQYRILVLPDHPTPIEIRGHTPDPVPFAMAGTNVHGVLHKPFCEENAFEAGFRVEQGHELMEYFLKI
ncbi:MAG: cofactor-independent phosphoglycerate mutase [Sedimentisphaerales bacterium]|nr:cofactor-independent phosphoglycerate mutase [Sedimentisphaerales bacterium]